jgi:hypothetical protein
LKQQLKQYMTYKPSIFADIEPAAIRAFCAQHRLAGVEEFADDLLDRNQPLGPSSPAYNQIVEDLKDRGCRRLHCSYWAYPTAFTTGRHFRELVERLGGPEQVIAYFGDLTGDKMLDRWVDEYRLAAAISADAYVFHLIDYAPIDGLWEFTMDRNTIAGAMVTLVQRFLNRLAEQGLITDTSPLIELENAGWGLEYGAQTPDDFLAVFTEVYDPQGRLRICWDLNHLLHALAIAADGGVGFALPPGELTPRMRDLAQRAQADSRFDLASAWVEECVLAPGLADRVGSVSVSDCARAQADYFCNGKLRDPEHGRLVAIADSEGQEEYGVRIVLEHYDSHLPLGQGLLNPEGVRRLLLKLADASPNAVVLHELKNSTNVLSEVAAQVDALGLNH